MTGEATDQKELVEQLRAQAKEQGARLVGLADLRSGLTTHDFRIDLGTEMTEPPEIRQ